MNGYRGYIDVCYIEEPFIFRINGDFTLEELKIIENDLAQDEDGLCGKYQGKEEVRFSVDYVETEVQYGAGYGDTYTIPGYYDLTCASVK